MSGSCARLRGGNRGLRGTHDLRFVAFLRSARSSSRWASSSSSSPLASSSESEERERVRRVAAGAQGLVAAAPDEKEEVEVEDARREAGAELARADW